ncbi:NurA domain protein [uncultured archaeon]|nr:NurA domain protein [uncultured archaeon]
MDWQESVVEAAKTYLARQDEWGECARRLRFNLGKIQYPEALEADLILPVSARPPAGSIAAVDGGLGTAAFHGLDLLAIKALAVRFDYENGQLIRHAYLPSAHPPITPYTTSSMDGFEQMRFSSLMRLRAELSAALSAAEKWKPSFLLLDGSIAPLVSDKPPEDSELKELYSSVAALYQKLYSTCSASGINLVGITKDSRGRRFLDLVSRAAPDSKDALASASDTSFLDLLLAEGERTFCMKYSVSPSTNPVLKDLGEWAARILAFYLKPTAGDRPLRVEFLSTAAPYNEVAQTICGLSRLAPHYAYPAVLIEADLRAAMRPDELEQVVADLSARIGRKRPLMPLRRDSRPFR